MSKEDKQKLKEYGKSYCKLSKNEVKGINLFFFCMWYKRRT